jgi:hypothetical protein
MATAQWNYVYATKRVEQKQILFIIYSFILMPMFGWKYGPGIHFNLPLQTDENKRVIIQQWKPGQTEYALQPVYDVHHRYIEDVLRQHGMLRENEGV